MTQPSVLSEDADLSCKNIPLQQQYGLSRWIFLRLLALCFGIAFTSFYVQCDALIGSQGISPVADFLSALSDQPLLVRIWRYPTLFWFSTSDSAIHVLSLLGIICSLLVLVNICTRLSLLLLWVLYLSVCVGGGIFYWYQWDALLLEAGLLGVFLAPGGIMPKLRDATPPTFVALFLYRWLLFRLMFSSGVVKILSGDTTWRDLSALSFHYITQPLPNRLAYYLWHAPLWVHQITTAVTLGIELFLPFLLYLGPVPRRIAALSLASLQVGIALTGSYTYFNLLSIALCLLAIDDGVWRRIWPNAPQIALQATLRLREKFADVSRHPFALLVLFVSCVKLFPLVTARANLPTVITDAAVWVEPFRSINSYGLFAVMTTERLEIVLEGSDDGDTWLPYEFRYKPGDLARVPIQAAPHQPRFDWQMWFAALGTYEDNPWFVLMLKRLLEGSPPVLAQFSSVPFPEHAPTYVRALLYSYTFTGMFEKETEHRWWKRELKGFWLPAVSLENFRQGKTE